MEHIEGNILIAEFMGMKLIAEHNHGSIHYSWEPYLSETGNWCFQEPPHFNSDWRWFMPVVARINLVIENMGNPSTLDYDIYESMQKWILDCKINYAWEDAISIITWYNEQKK